MTTMLEMILLLPPASSATAKELIEHILMTKVPMSGWIPSLLLSLDAFLAMLIVHAPLLGVAECLVRVGNRLELFLCTLRVVLVLVRVELNRHLLEALLDLIFGGTPLQT